MGHTQDILHDAMATPGDPTTTPPPPTVEAAGPTEAAAAPPVPMEEQPKENGGAKMVTETPLGKEYDNPELGQHAEAAALNISEQLNLQALPIRQYLESTVVSLLVNGLTSLAKARPEDPVEYLAAFLMKNNPKNQKKA